MKRPSFLSNQPVKNLISSLKKQDDFIHFENEQHHMPYRIFYFYTLIDSEVLHRDLLENLNKSFNSLPLLKNQIPFTVSKLTDDEKEVKEKLLQGYVAIQLLQNEKEYLLILCKEIQGRGVTPPEIEFSVEGPKEAFVESLKTNINLIRKRLPVTDLQITIMNIGKTSKTDIGIVYLENKVNEEDVKLITSRLNRIKLDQILDSAYIQQIVQDNWRSPFPQLKNTERPDRVCGQLCEGKVVILVDGSSFALCGPTSIVDFFSSMEDYYLTWQVGSVFRFIRYAAVVFSILATPLYVAVLTYHYQLIPRDLLGTLIGSRVNIPFPPVLEALFLELTIELLREAGARLPTKVGQTIGIVGGIVIGQASVEAGLTSNVLLIIVALTALASFTTPIYRMGNAIRLLRFPFLFFASLWGLFGIVICGAFLLTHLIRLTSLGHPYFTPIYPPRIKEWKDTFVRFPYRFMRGHQIPTKVKDPIMANVIDTDSKSDIDE